MELEKVVLMVVEVVCRGVEQRCVVAQEPLGAVFCVGWASVGSLIERPDGWPEGETGRQEGDCLTALCFQVGVEVVFED